MNPILKEAQRTKQPLYLHITGCLNFGGGKLQYEQKDPRKKQLLLYVLVSCQRQI